MEAWVVVVLVVVALVLLAVASVWYRRTRRRGHIIQTDAPGRGSPKGAAR
jgi:hypothetical protein